MALWGVYALSVFLAITQPVVQWSGNGSAVDIRMPPLDQDTEQCLQSGLDVRAIFDIKVCARGTYWFDDCTDRYRETRTVQYDAVSESYSIITDIFTDGKRPQTLSGASYEEASSALRALEALPLARVGEEVQDLLQQRKAYLSVRVRGSCLEEERSFGARVPYYLTLGMFRFVGFDSGWIDFSLDRS